LVRCGLVYSERKGKEMIYALNGETMETIFNLVETHAQKYCPSKGSCAYSQ